ncbi:hypothetical protein MIR68_009850 [Amoeboaphelidium protococcarum]|nr:hypothetical protein MIR68_009850 [Amoeboaphelidium protococcarum]
MSGNNDDNLRTFKVLKQDFTLDKKYVFEKELGVGAYGVVCGARDTSLGINVAIKKINKIFDKRILAKRTLRELKLLRHFNAHENIISIIDVVKPAGNSFECIYLVQELMEADMHQIIRSQQPLTDAHFQYFLYQILRGLKYIHSANVLHRDLKPGNLLVNADCELKICDFGLARGHSDMTDHTGFMTEYVATRWYRAPEIMLSFQNYTKAIDIWSVGCIFAEMLGGKVLFPGKDYVHQLNLILQIVGTPSDETIRRIGSPRAQDYVKSLPRMPKVPFPRLYPNATPVAIDLLEKLLDFDPSRRITVEQALQHPYLETYHDPEDEPTCSPIDFSFENLNKIDDLKKAIVDEINTYYGAKQLPKRSQRAQSVQMDASIVQNAATHGHAAGGVVGGKRDDPMDTVAENGDIDAGHMDVDKELEQELERGVPAM